MMGAGAAPALAEAVGHIAALGRCAGRGLVVARGGLYPYMVDIPVIVYVLAMPGRLVLCLPMPAPKYISWPDGKFLPCPVQRL